MDASEASLLDRARAGDARAFASLVETYWPQVHRWLFALARHEQAAEDLTQEAFLRAWKALGGLREGLRFRPWLFSIARNCLVDRQRGLRGSMPLELPESIASPSVEPLEEIVYREMSQFVQAECERLPLAYRAALLLWIQERMPYADMAQALGTTEETARWRVCKARQMLQERLSGYLDRKVP